MARRELTLDELRRDSGHTVSTHTLTSFVVKPLGTLFVELWDKSGRVRHANRDYTIDGPMQFSGTTDDDGRLLHENVIAGDYTLTLTLEFFDGEDQVSDTYEVALVVQSP